MQNTRIKKGFGYLLFMYLLGSTLFYVELQGATEKDFIDEHCR